MTDLTIPLAKLREKGADVDLLREMVQFMAQRLMEIDVSALCGADYDEKSPATRTNRRNGYRDRLWNTRAGGGGPEDPQAPSGHLLSRLP